MKMLFKISMMWLLMTNFCYSQYPIESNSIFSIIDTLKIADEKLYLIYDLNVFDYYKLNSYDTDLKKEVYKKTTEYSEQLAELKKMKTNMLKTPYYVLLENAFVNGYEPVNYDLKKKGFYIGLGSNEGGGSTYAIPPKSLPICNKNREILPIYLKSLPTTKVAGILGLVEKLFIPLDEERGLEIENAKKDIVVYFIFIPSGKEIISYTFEDTRSGTLKCKTNALKADKVRMIVANKTTGKILFDKNYTYKPPSTSTTKK